MKTSNPTQSLDLANISTLLTWSQIKLHGYFVCQYHGFVKTDLIGIDWRICPYPSRLVHGFNSVIWEHGDLV